MRYQKIREGIIMKVESFSLDHTIVKAPFVRKCGVYNGQKGDQITKFDLRFMQPNKEEMQTGAIHTLEHLMAGWLRDEIDGIIDLSPMGCRTGFYLTVWGDREPKEIIEGLGKALKKVLEADEVPATTEKECGNYRDHSLEGAKELASKVLEQGISDKVFV
jgi:S-ribosylhomocysteine lyase